MASSISDQRTGVGVPEDIDGWIQIRGIILVMNYEFFSSLRRGGIYTARSTESLEALFFFIVLIICLVNTCPSVLNFGGTFLVEHGCDFV